MMNPFEFARIQMKLKDWLRHRAPVSLSRSSSLSRPSRELSNRPQLRHGTHRAGPFKVVETDAGQETFSPEEYYSRAKYGWKNDPDQVRLVK